MNPATHALAGIAVQKAVKSWKYTVPLALLSHVLLDNLWQVSHAPRILGIHGIFTVLLLRRFPRCWPGIVAALCLDIEWLIGGGWIHQVFQRFS